MHVNKTFKYNEVLGLKFGRSLIGIPKMFAHIYFVDGLLIDTGQSKLRKRIVKETSNLPVKKIFITHHHEDHTGNIDRIKEIHQCPVYAPKSCCEIMKKPPKLSLAQKLLWGDRKASHDLNPLDSEIKTDNFCFEIVPIPGHAPDMVALYEPNKKWLFSADLYINNYIGYILKDESMAEQIQSLKKVLQLDFKAMFCSHNPQFENGKQQLAKKLDYFESFFEDVATLYNKGHGPEEIFKDLNLKENRIVKTLSNGQLSKLNMVKSVIRDLEKGCE